MNPAGAILDDTAKDIPTTQLLAQGDRDASTTEA